MRVLHDYIIVMQESDDILKKLQKWRYALENLEYDLYPQTTVFKLEKIWLLNHAQKELWKCDFWRSTFSKVSNRHSLQKEYYLLGKTPTPQEVDLYLYKVIKRLRNKYELSCSRSTLKDFVELNLGLSYLSSRLRKRQIINASEIEVYIDEDQITVGLLPYSNMAVKFHIDEYLVVENLLNDLCAELFASPAKEIQDFQSFRKRIQTEDKALNQKSIEIARASIKSLFEKFPEADKKLFSGYLFSNLTINGKSEVILHKDFLENPQLLTSKLQKK